MARALSVLYWLLVGIVAIGMFALAFVVWAITLPFDRRRVVLHAFTNFWAALYTWFNPVWSVRIRGRHNLEPGRTYVMVSNHLSLVDIFVIHRLFRHFKWISKAENFRMPFIGWNMILNGYIPLRRGDRHSVREMFTLGRKALAAGSSVMVFPEGTRSRTGQLTAFKPGAFELAKQARVGVLPIAIEGTFHALEPRTLAISPARMQVTVLPAIPSDEVEALEVEDLEQRAWERIAAEVGTAGERGDSRDGPRAQ